MYPLTVLKDPETKRVAYRPKKHVVVVVFFFFLQDDQMHEGWQTSKSNELHRTHTLHSQAILLACRHIRHVAGWNVGI